MRRVLLGSGASLTLPGQTAPRTGGGQVRLSGVYFRPIPQPAASPYHHMPIHTTLWQRPVDDHFLARLPHGQANAWFPLGRSGTENRHHVSAPHMAGRARLGFGAPASSVVVVLDCRPIRSI